MYKTITLLLFTVFYTNAVLSQQTYVCGQNEKMNRVSIPEKTENSTINHLKSNGYVIPVVVHVLHLNGTENVSDDQIHLALEALNEDFNRQNWDIINVVPDFAGNIADIGVTFKLAKLDPEGNPTTGINRIYTNLTNHGWEDSSQINQWPPRSYLNIWVCKSLEGYAAAYAWYPEYAEFYPERDGIMVQHDYLGYTGTAGEYARHVLTHEAGHYFNLKHTWDDVIGSGPCGDDEVADTPITQYSGCDLTLADCNPPIVENVQNFMTASYCDMMFTEGQKERMLNCLNSSMGGRNNLWQEENLIETGLMENTADVSAVSNNKFYVYPNPAKDELMIYFESDPGAIILTDLYGNSVNYSFTKTDNQIKITLSGLSAGTYFIGRESRNEKIVVIK